MDLNRGDIVICALKGDFGKPRPAVVLQSDLFNSTHSSISICPITTHLIDTPIFRLPLESSKKNGLLKTSQIMVDKIMTIQKEKISQKIGKLSLSELTNLNHAIKIWLGLE